MWHKIRKRGESVTTRRGARVENRQNVFVAKREWMVLPSHFNKIFKVLKNFEAGERTICYAIIVADPFM